ncbi:MAG: hypothetical protein ACRCWM_07730 [Sarcina sp.]
MKEIDLINLSSISVNKKYIEYEEEFTQEIIIRNRSEMDIFNIVIRDTLKEGCKFFGNGARIDGHEEIGNHPALGINIIKLQKGMDTIISINFKCMLKEGGTIKNSALIEYQYYDYECEEYKSVFKELLGENIFVNEANFSNDKLLFKSDNYLIDVKEKNEISLRLFNSGNISANNVLVSINLPKEIKRASEEIYINEKKFFLNKGLREIKIGKISPLEEVLITFSCEGIYRSNTVIEGFIRYETFINPNEIRTKELRLNGIRICIASPKLKVDFTTSDSNPIKGDIINSTVKIQNMGNLSLLKGRLFLDIPETLTLQGENIFLDSLKREGSEIIKGIYLGELSQMQMKTLEFQLKCVQSSIEKDSKISGRLVYEFEGENSLKYKEETLKETIIKIDDATCDMKVKGSKKRVVLDDVLTYKIYLENTGSLELLNVFIKSNFSSGIIFVKDTLKVNGRSFNLANINKGICIGNIDVAEKVSIEFSVKIQSISISGLQIETTGEFQYRNKMSNIKKKPIESVKTVIQSGASLFKSFSIEDTCTLPRHLPGIKEILEFNSNIIITEKYIIKSNVDAKSNLSTSNKLFIKGYIEDKIEYISNEISENVYLVINKTLFSNFIIIPDEFNDGRNIELESEAKNEYARIIDSRHIYLLNIANIEGRVIN